jgi:cytidylate kinase
MMKKPIIAIDGPAGAGKSTLAKNIARELGLIYIDSGAMYRAFGLKCVSAGISSDDIKEINSILEKTVVEFKSLNGELKVFLDGKDITNRIRTPEAGRAASIFSAIPTVRNKMIALQRKIGAGGGVVMDGRDIGTVVFPDAEVKIFLEAGNETRAIRRYKELFGEEKEPDISSSEFQKILYEQAGRDNADTNRASSPLKPAADAVVLDSTLMTKDDVFNKVLTLIKERSIKTKNK